MRQLVVGTTLTLLLGIVSITTAEPRDGFGPGKQDWGYIDVRPGAHMFYWLYYTTANVTNYYQRPLMIWLQGGPSTSGTGYGNFEEIGPLDVAGRPRSTTWVKNFNVLFIDSPVGSGWSFVDEEDYLHCETNREVGQDLVSFMRQFLRRNPNFKGTPIHVVGEGYGGKMAADFVRLMEFEIKQELLEANLKSLVVGNPWISPSDSVLSWAPFLYQMGYIDFDGYENVMEFAEEAADAAYYEEWLEATGEWSSGATEMIITTDGINFDNILTQYSRFELPFRNLTISLPEFQPKSRRNSRSLKRYSKTVRSTSRKSRRNFNDKVPPSSKRDLSLWSLMNGPVAETLGVNRTWWGNREAVFYFLEYDFMKDCLYTVARLLDDTDLKVVIYTGQLDLNAPTSGTVEWLNEWLDWSGAAGYQKASRESVEVDEIIEGFKKAYRNLEVYWVLRAGLKAPADNPKFIEKILLDL